MKRHLFRSAVATSAVVFCPTMLLWVVGNFWTLDCIYIGKDHVFSIGSRFGLATIIARKEELSANMGWLFVEQAINDQYGPVSIRYRLSANLPWLPGLAMYRTAYVLYIPLWLIALLSFPLPAVSFVRHRRRRRRQQQGLCVRCGYDLRASKDGCPECGTPIAAKESAA